MPSDPTWSRRSCERWPNIPIGPPPPLPAPTGASPAAAAPAAAPAATDTGDTAAPTGEPTRLAINGVRADVPPAPGSDAARTRPAPELAPVPPIAGWLENGDGAEQADLSPLVSAHATHLAEHRRHLLQRLRQLLKRLRDSLHHLLRKLAERRTQLRRHLHALLHSLLQHLVLLTGEVAGLLGLRTWHGCAVEFAIADGPPGLKRDRLVPFPRR